MNRKVISKFNYQELEELNFALSDRISKVTKKSDDVRYVKFINKLLSKIRKKIESY